MTRALALGIDLGSSSARAFLFDEGGRQVAGAKVHHEWRTTPDGGVETGAEELVRLLADAVDGAVALLPRDGRIAAVGTSALWHSIVGVDAAGAPVTPVLAWSDMRARDVCVRLRKTIDERALHQRTGARLHPGYVPPRLAWLREVHPDRYARARSWMSAAEYVGLRLFGERVVATAMAAGSGLLDQHTVEWDAESLAIAGIERAQLSAIVDTGAVHGSALRGEFASRWPALRGVPWLVAVGDGACANVGSGCMRPDRMTLSMGTSAAVRVMVPAGVEIPERLWAYRFDGGRTLIGGALSNGGNVHQRLRELLRLPDDDDALERLVAALPPDARGIDMLPFFAGERSPDWPLAARAVVRGMTLDTTPAELLRAGMEAVAYRLALLRRLVRSAIPTARRVVASGAPLEHSPTWSRILADVLGEPLHVSLEPEASSRGAALLALHACGEGEDPARAEAPAEDVIEPDRERHERYARAMARQLELSSEQ